MVRLQIIKVKGETSIAVVQFHLPPELSKMNNVCLHFLCRYYQFDYYMNDANDIFVYRHWIYA